MQAYGEKLRVDEAVEQCLQDCYDCQVICLQTLRHCLERGGPLATDRQVRILMDCARICETATDFMLRCSPLYETVCAAAGEVAERCAEECARFSDDLQMLSCAEMCRTAAASCGRIAAARVV